LPDTIFLLTFFLISDITSADATVRIKPEHGCW
jgi:hypothetical protein